MCYTEVHVILFAQKLVTFDGKIAYKHSQSVSVAFASHVMYYSHRRWDPLMAIRQYCCKIHMCCLPRHGISVIIIACALLNANAFQLIATHLIVQFDIRCLIELIDQNKM